jgi:isoleucyl-tRNA synthetase
VHLSDWPVLEFEADAELEAAFAKVLAVREAVTKALEEARNAKVVGKSQEASVHVSAPAELVDALERRGLDALAELFIVASVDIVEADGLSVTITASPLDKCPRCWNLRRLGADSTHPEVCARCADVLAGME